MTHSEIESVLAELKPLQEASLKSMQHDTVTAAIGVVMAHMDRFVLDSAESRLCAAILKSLEALRPHD